MEFKAFLTSLGTSFVLFVVLMLLFTWLARRSDNYVIYYSNWILKGLDPTERGKKTRNPIAWIREALSSTEADVINVSGVDSAVYFVFLTTVFSILVFAGILLLPVLLPVAGTDHSLIVVTSNDTVSQGAFNNLDKLSMGHVGLFYYLNFRSGVTSSTVPLLLAPLVAATATMGYRKRESDKRCRFMATSLSHQQPQKACAHSRGSAFRSLGSPVWLSPKSSEGNPRLWAFLIATYWVSLLAYYLLWKAYKHVSDLRANALRSSDAKAEQFAIIVRDIPQLTKGQTRKEQVDSYFQKIYPDTFYRSMVVTDNTKVNEIYEKLEGLKKKLARAEAVYAKSKTTSNPEGKKPSHKVGFLGLVGKKVDSIGYFKEKISKIIPKLAVEQKVTLREKQKSSALVFFTSRVVAASASQSLHAQLVDTWTVIDAPEPSQIIWTNLTKKFYERVVRQYLVYFIVFLTIFFYMIPIALISAFTTLENLKKIMPFTKPVVDQPVVNTVLEAYLPQLALIVFLAMLPKLLLFLSKSEGIPTEAHIHRAASGKFFYFNVLNVFIGVTIGSTLFNTLKQIEQKPNSAFDLVANSLPKSATFFLTYVALQFFVGYGLELSRLVPLILFHLKKKYLCITDDEIKEAWAPGDLEYATRFPNDMLIVTIVLCYSVIAPIIIPFGAVYFGLGWLVLRNQVLKVYVPSYESYGRMWPHIFTRIMASLILYQVTMVGFIGVKKFAYTPILIPLPIVSLIYCYVCSKKFYRFFQATALEVASDEMKETACNMERVFRSFIPPSLSAEKSDDDQFEDALSVVSRSASCL